MADAGEDARMEQGPGVTGTAGHARIASLLLPPRSS